MKTIMTVCGTGLGSSFFVEINIGTLLQKWGLQDKYRTTHGAVFEVSEEDADYFITAKDLEDTLSYLPNLIVLDSIVDMDELEHKLYDKLKADIEETFE